MNTDHTKEEQDASNRDDNAQAHTDVIQVDISGPGVQISKTVPLRKLTAIMAALFGDSAYIGHIQAHSASREASGKQSATPHTSELNDRTTIREFLNHVEPSTHAETLTTIGFFLWRKEGKEKFTAGDIKAGFKAAREPLPGNLSRDLGTASQAGWIANGDHSREYFITNTGEKAVNSKFVEV